MPSDLTVPHSTRWRRIVRWIGGVWEAGPLAVVIHDGGAFWAWRQVVKGEWRA